MTSVFEPGHVLNNMFELIEFVAGGGQAEVWSVRNIEYPHHLDLAAKFRYTDFERRDEFEFTKHGERLREEARLLGGCRSNYIVRPHAQLGGLETVGADKYAVLGVVMDYARDGNLLQFSRQGAFSTFSKAERFNFLKRLALGLRSLQHWKIVHNDIKPANILIMQEAEEFVPAYADFGYAFQVGHSMARGGTPGYMAPELIVGGGDPSYESDVYSLGITFYEILLGQHPLEKLLAVADQMQALRGYFSTNEYIDSRPLEEIATHELSDLIQNMCSREASRRPPVSEILEVLDSVTQETLSRAIISPEDLYPQIANRFRWAAEVHQAFGELEKIVFLDGTRPDFDPLFLVTALAKEKITGFTILRLLGSSDYVLRLWHREAEWRDIDGVLRSYRAERGATDVFAPTLRRPQPKRPTRERYSRSTEALHLLQSLADGDSRTIRAAQRAGVIAGESKTARERGHRQHLLRALCRVRLKKAITADLADAIADRAIEVAEVRGVRSVEVLGDPGDGNRSAEFVLVLELSNFHAYPEIVQRLERIMSGLVGAESVDRFRSSFEMDEASTYESYDGRLLHELYRHRPRRG